MTASPEIQAVIDALEDVVTLLRRHGGEWGERVSTGVDQYRFDLAKGDVQTLTSVLADTTGGNGSIRDVSLIPADGPSASMDDWRALSNRMFAATAAAADACRVAMRSHGLDVWR